MKSVAIVQARMGSTRLPAKIMMELDGEPMLCRCLNRLARAGGLDYVMVATTVQPRDEVVLSLCTSKGWPCFLGSEEDVLDRYRQAACMAEADIVLRVTSDCPLIDPSIVEDVLALVKADYPNVDYASTNFPKRTFPIGLDVEALTFEALDRIWHEDDNVRWREHVTPYIYRNPDLFTIRGLQNTEDYSHIRWTVDTLEDLELVRRMYKHFGHDKFSWREALVVMKAYPEWLQINSHVQQKYVPG